MTHPLAPANFYGDSKVKAEEGLRKLEDESFKVVILHPPMIYGKGSKGNHPILAKMARKLPVFPDVQNISFADNPLFEMTIPAKLQSYMACGMPILASATGETERIIQDAECGIACGLGDANALFDAILNLMEMRSESIRIMLKNAAAYYGRHFDKKDLLDRLDVIIGE